MRPIHRLRGWFYHRTGRLSCGCLLLTVEYLDGQHRRKCKTNRIGDGVTVAPLWISPQPKHQVDGVRMPHGWMPNPDADLTLRHRFPVDLDIRWVDMSGNGDGAWVARRWPEIRRVATAIRVDEQWRWKVMNLAGGVETHTGLVGDLRTALDEAEAVIQQLFDQIHADVDAVLAAVTVDAS